MLKAKTVKGSHWTISHLPANGKKTFRVRWKDLKSLGYPMDPTFGKVHYFSTQKQAKDFATEKIDEIQRVGRLADALDSEEKGRILREAARLAERGINPLKAMEEGARHLIAFGNQSEMKIGEFWPAYVARKKADKKWGVRNAKAQESFFESMKDSLMQRPIKNFVHIPTGQTIIREALEKYRSRSGRNASNTIRGARSKIRTFLFYVASEVEALNQTALKEIFSHEYLLPAGLKKEAANVAITATQARYLLGYMAAHKLAGWIVLKLFMGARTLLVQEWKWSIVDWENGRIMIPMSQTKLKKTAIRFSIKEIPNFSEWLNWAWQLDGRPKPQENIARFSQPTITKLVAKAINERKELFTDDKRKTIKPVESLRNFMRSGFITYGTQIPALGVGKVMKIAEDAHNLDKYLAWDSATGPEPEAEAFWSLTPDQILVPSVPPTRSRRKRSRNVVA